MCHSGSISCSGLGFCPCCFGSCSLLQGMLVGCVISVCIVHLSASASYLQLLLLVHTFMSSCFFEISFACCFVARGVSLSGSRFGCCSDVMSKHCACLLARHPLVDEGDPVRRVCFPAPATLLSCFFRLFLGSWMLFVASSLVCSALLSLVFWFASTVLLFSGYPCHGCLAYFMHVARLDFLCVHVVVSCLDLCFFAIVLRSGSLFLQLIFVVMAGSAVVLFALGLFYR